ncbi:MAG: hypothetical protein F6K41_36510 [Symploca sp. SIO3E6]|nr:hypothetical protein [Caldora sp. SIO3E6]
MQELSSNLKTSSGIIHIVTIREGSVVSGEPSNLEQAYQRLLAGLREQLPHFQANYGLELLFFGDRIKPEETTKRLKHDLPLNAKHVIAVAFPNKESLEKYYFDEHHVKIRRQFYCDLSPSLQLLYELMDRSESQAVAARLKLIIEQLVGSVLERRDYYAD